MDGFCCGLAIVIGESQLHPFQVGHGDDKSWRSGLQLFWMLLIMIVAMLVMEFVPKLPCKAAKLSKFEIPEKVVLIEELWTPENDMLTAVQKLKRREIVAKHKAEIDRVYI